MRVRPFLSLTTKIQIMKRPLFLALAATFAMTAFAQRTLTVDKNGNGDFTSLQEAVDAVAEGEQTIIRLAAGTYEEKVSIGTRQKNSTKRISLVGDGIDKTILTAAYGKNTIGNSKDVRDYATLAVFADDFYAENLTIRNTSGKAGGQALALFVSGDRQTYYRCKIAGYQDTHRSKKSTRSYYKECILEGATDFIYAGGTCWFERCTLNCVAGGYITAPEDIVVSTTTADGRKMWLGFIFNRCTVTRSAGVADGSVFLGRPWNKDLSGAGVLYLNCDINQAIHSEGWTLMSGSTGKNVCFAEYKSRNGQNLADVTQRVAWSTQLTESDYDQVNSWAKVDAIFRQKTGNGVAFDPDAVIAAHRQQSTLAFPTAEGFGKFASGGRGGKVVEVTNLDDSGEGSLRWALTEAGKQNATIVFRVSGTITIGPNPQRPTENSIRASLKNVTIAGQTAPGEGILLRGGKLNLGGSNNVIIRNIRSRLGTGEDSAKSKAENFIEGGSIGIENARNIIVDHCSFGWSGEENMTMYDNHFTTVQWCIVHDGLYDAGHKKGSRGYGCQWGGSPATFHHNLLANNDSRSARINGASNEGGDRNVFLEYINNVNFNWGRQNSCYGGENEAGSLSSHECNFVGNYYKPGPARTNPSYFVEMSGARSGKKLNGPSVWYLEGNVMEGNAEASADNWRQINNRTGYALSEMRSEDWIYPSPAYQRLQNATVDDYDLYRTPAESATEAYEHVLARAGTIRRDAVERRVIDDVISGQPRYRGASARKQGIIDTPADAEGYFDYPAAEPVKDNDHDGMADDWELANGFNPSDPDDGHRVVSPEGYTALEVYLNHLMGEEITFEPTAVGSIRLYDTTNPLTYNLLGQRVVSSSTRGLLIRNGRKVFIR